MLILNGSFTQYGGLAWKVWRGGKQAYRKFIKSNKMYAQINKF